MFVVPVQSPQSGPGAPPQVSSGAAGDSLSPELFTGILQGVLSTMMSSLGAQQGNEESIAQFIQRLSQSSNLFTPGSGDAVGQSEINQQGCLHYPFIAMVHQAKRKQNIFPYNSFYMFFCSLPSLLLV